MAGINKVILVGNLGAKPELKYGASGNAVTNLSVATSDSWTDKNTGQKQERTEWHRVSLFGKLAEVAAQYTDKGSKVYVEGKLQTTKYTDNAGIEKYSTSVVVGGFNGVFQMLDRRDDSNMSTPSESSNTPMETPTQNAQSAPKITPVAKDDFEDDIPF
jgi:single-strand DNA-binding protein